MKKPLRRAFAPIIVLCVFAVFATAPRSATAADAPPYEEGLLRLSELMGSIHYLRALCGAQDGDRWRDEMEALVDAEGSSNEDRRRRLVERFNRGYRAFASVYRECTPSARKAVESYMAEGAELSAEISARYSR